MAVMIFRWRLGDRLQSLINDRKMAGVTGHCYGPVTAMSRKGEGGEGRREKRSGVFSELGACRLIRWLTPRWERKDSRPTAVQNNPGPVIFLARIACFGGPDPVFHPEGGTVLSQPSPARVLSRRQPSRARSTRLRGTSGGPARSPSNRLPAKAGPVCCARLGARSPRHPGPVERKQPGGAALLATQGQPPCSLARLGPGPCRRGRRVPGRPCGGEARAAEGPHWGMGGASTAGKPCGDRTRAGDGLDRRG